MDGRLLLGVVIGLLITWAAFVALLWLFRPRGVGLRELVASSPTSCDWFGTCCGDRSVSRGVRLALLALLLWLVSPIDLIPEFIPVVGPLDDVVVAVLVLRFVRRRLGDEELRRRWHGSPASFDFLLSVLGGAPTPDAYDHRR